MEGENYVSEWCLQVFLMEMPLFDLGRAENLLVTPSWINGAKIKIMGNSSVTGSFYQLD